MVGRDSQRSQRYTLMVWLLAALAIFVNCAGGEVASGGDSGDRTSGGEVATASGTSSSSPGDRGKWLVLTVTDDNDEQFLTQIRDGLDVAVLGGAEVDWVVSSPEGLADAMTAGLSGDVDVIVGVGRGVLDEFSYTAAENLDHTFVLVDAVPAEPTQNLATVAFDEQTCPIGARCAVADDIVDLTIRQEREAADVSDALRQMVADVESGQLGLVTLYSLADVSM